MAGWPARRLSDKPIFSSLENRLGVFVFANMEESSDRSFPFSLPTVLVQRVALYDSTIKIYLCKSDVCFIP